MKFMVVYNPDFYDDLIEAVAWYNDQQPGLGDRFSSFVKMQSSKLTINALHFSVKYDNVRCMGIEKFPFLLHYRVNTQSKTVFVEALFHMSRSPEKWGKRKPK